MAGAVALGLGAMALAGPIYRWEIRKTVEEMNGALNAVDTAIRSLDIFGENPPTPAAPSPYAAQAQWNGY